MGKLLLGMTVLLSLLLLISIKYDQPLWWVVLLGAWLFVTLLFSWCWILHDRA